MDMRVSAGEVVAALYEAAVSTIDETFKFPNQHHLLEILAGLATDSVKYRAKKDRKVQRSSFRQIYNAVEQQEWPSFDVKFDGEVLTGDSYGVKLLYDAVCSVLKSGTNAHLKSNILLREVFDLGPVVDRTTGRTSKLQRVGHLVY
ncbi:hypothetical protein AB6A40_011559 [Gnathostoma spinigerum]|uniref:Uncharacterized protein n=1 Tax=Gnathostoma spinigerum TaxID=75299 RepID=A0ABD6EZD9_9BILA